jgi:chromosome segregation ATPase
MVSAVDHPASIELLQRELADTRKELERRGGPPYDGGVEARIAKLESDLGHVTGDVREIKTDIREIKKESREDFRILFGSTVLATLGLAGLIAKGFGWL